MSSRFLRLSSDRAVGLVAVLAAAALWSPVAALRAAMPPAEKLLPADTLLVLTVPDCAAWRSHLKQSPQWLCWKDPAMKPFRDHFMTKWKEEFAAPLERDLGVKLADFGRLLQGQLDFAITRNGWTGQGDQKPGVLLLLDSGDQGGLLRTNLAALRRKWVEANKPVRTERIHGVEFSVVTLSSNDMPKTLARFFPPPQPVRELGRKTETPPPAELFVGQFQSLLIVGNSEKAVVPVAARLTGGSVPSLSDNPLYAADRLALFRNSPLYYAWFNARAFFDAVARIPSEAPNPEAPSPMPRIPWHRVLTASGLTGLKSAALSYREDQEGATLDFHLAVPETSRRGLFKIMAANQKDAYPPRFVPADVVKFWRWRVDGSKSWTALQQMIREISPTAASSLNLLLDTANSAAQQKAPGFDVRQSLFNNLGDDFVDYQAAPKGKSLKDLNSAPSLFLFAPPDPDQAIHALRGLGALVDPEANTTAPRAFLGRKIYSLKLSPRYAVGQAKPVKRVLYIAASGGYVGLTSDESMLENYLRSADSQIKPLRDLAGLRAAGQHVGGAGSGLFGYDNQHEIMRSLFATLKQDSATARPGLGLLSRLPFDTPLKQVGAWLDFSLLPDFDKVSKYFSITVYGGNTTVDGLSFKFFTPRPPQLRR